jgi:hypothetical protein
MGRTSQRPPPFGVGAGPRDRPCCGPCGAPDWRGSSNVRLLIPIAAFRAQGRLRQLSAINRHNQQLFDDLVGADQDRNGGTARPSVLAVLRLTISSIFVACWTGRSPGFSPLRIRPIGHSISGGSLLLKRTYTVKKAAKS